MRFLPTVAWALALVGVAGVAAAQPASDGPVPIPKPKTAAEFHAAALRLAELGEIAGSIPFFKRAIALEDNATYECNFAAALAHLKEKERAHAMFIRCVDRVAAIDPAQGVSVRKYIAQIEGDLAATDEAVGITSTPPHASVTISTWPDDEPVSAPTLIWLRPGTYTITARLPGHRDASDTVTITADGVATHEHESVSLTLADVPVEPDHGVTVVRHPRSKRPAIITLAAGGALLAGGGVVHYLSRDVRAELASRSGQPYHDYLPTWHTYQYATIGLYAAGTVTLAIGSYLYLHERSPAPIAVTPTADGAGAMVWLWSP